MNEKMFAIVGRILAPQHSMVVGEMKATAAAARSIAIMPLNVPEMVMWMRVVP